MIKINVKNVRGMPDVFGAEAKLMEYIFCKSKKIAKQYNFSSFFTPILEFSEIFERTIGQSSDIVSKEIYSFVDRSDNKLALRPEFTASVIRAFVSNGLQASLPQKLFSYGPVFRYDRPQKCRQRQFNQINYEFIGVKQNDPIFDAEMIFLASQILENLQIQNFSSYKIHINSIGNEKTRENFCIALKNFLNLQKENLSEDALFKLKTNPLRILDTKILSDKEILKNGPKISEFYDEESRIFFTKLCQYLDVLKISYLVDQSLVRGLDYYENTVFEIVTDELGAQGTILAGGRYSSLSEHFGIERIPCFGFAAGVERLMGLILNEENKKIERIEFLNKILQDDKKKILIMCLGDQNIETGFKIFKNLKSCEEIICEIIFEKKFQKMLEKANKNAFNYAIFVGDEEILQNQFLIRDLKTGEQKALEIEKIKDFFETKEII